MRSSMKNSRLVPKGQTNWTKPAITEKRTNQDAYHQKLEELKHSKE